MLRVNQITCPIDHTETQLFSALCRKLKCRESDILSWKILKRSLDARKKPRLFFSYILLAECREEEKLLKRLKKDKDLAKEDSQQFRFQVTGKIPLRKRPVIIGTGPAGLFCGLELAKAGFCPILLERGKDVERRTADVEAFWKGGTFSENSNVQFGEGGAGTFSDGKLNTLVKDKSGRNTHVLETFVRFGAKENILYDQKPHLGTDVLKKIVKGMREEIVSLGGEVYFERTVTNIETHIAENDRKIAKIEINGNEWLETEVLVPAIGHSARDTFFLFYDKGLKMEAKPFAVGFRVQHPQDFINRAQYGEQGKAALSVLGAASYKLTAKAADGRGVYTFCMCPGGYVVNASSEKGHLAVNGMSYSGRDGECANSAVIVSVEPKDFVGMEDSHPLAGIYFQRELERKAYEAAAGKIPVQKYGDFCEMLLKNGIIKEPVHRNAIRPFLPAVKGLYEEADLTGIMPPVLCRAFWDGMEQMDGKIHGFASDEVWLCGIESRTSSPVRICRDETGQSNIRGIYPCGEGAGYAGGITSAAMDGIKTAQEIAKIYRPAVLRK